MRKGSTTLLLGAVLNGILVGVWVTVTHVWATSATIIQAIPLALVAAVAAAVVSMIVRSIYGGDSRIPRLLRSPREKIWARSVGVGVIISLAATYIYILALQEPGSPDIGGIVLFALAVALGTAGIHFIFVSLDARRL